MKMYVLGCDTTLNPRKPARSAFLTEFRKSYDPSAKKLTASAYIYERLSGVPEGKRGSLRIVLSAGAFSDVKVGDEHTLYGDQSMRRIGIYRVVGIKHFTNGRTVGDVPDRALPLSVFK